MPIPEPVAERLARLARLLEKRAEEGHEGRVSASELERLTGWPCFAIRKDISLIGADAWEEGFAPADLAASIRRALRLESEAWNCCVAGLGRLGSSFLDCSGFAGTPFRIVAGFDSSINRIEILESAFPLYPAFRMKEVIPRLDIRLALLCVPEEAAKRAAEMLFSLGVRGIVNFTPAVISPPAGAAVENVSAVCALEALAAWLSSNTNDASRREK